MHFFSAAEIESAISIERLVNVFEKAFKQQEEFKVPNRMHISDGDNTALLMPVFDQDYYAIKLVGVAPHNSLLNKSSIHGTVLLHDRKTFEPIAMFDGQSVTALRTGAIGGLGIRYLAKRRAETIGIVGTGVQGWSHLKAAIAVRPIKQVFLFNRNIEKAEAFANKIREVYPMIEVYCSNIEDLVRHSEIIVTATTSTSPVLPDLASSMWEGKLIVAVGSFKPNMQELPRSLLEATSTFFIDTINAINESGDIIRAKEIHGNSFQYQSIDQIVQMNPDIGRIGIFKTVGSALFDLLTVRAVYEAFYQGE